MRKSRGLQLAEIAEQRSGGSDGSIIMLADSQPLERKELEVASQLLARKRGIELPCLAFGHERSLCADAGGSGGQVASASRTDDLSWRQAGQQRSDIVRSSGVEAELPGRQVSRCDPESDFRRATSARALACHGD